MDLISIVGLVIGLIIVVLIAVWAFIARDLMSYTTTGSETLSPAGETRENALVVYSPGISGAAKNAAVDMAKDLKSRGYKVDLAGVRSKTANNTSSYDIIIAGGPMYFGKVSSSIDSYLKKLELKKEVRLGVFGTTGSEQLVNDDYITLGKQVESSSSGDSLNKKMVIKLIRSGKESTKDCKDFISEMLQ
jgi:hypothetical protein